MYRNSVEWSADLRYFRRTSLNWKSLIPIRLKGDTAGTGGKPATLSTGAVVKVPLFVQIGEVIKVDTRSGEYVSRVK